MDVYQTITNAIVEAIEANPGSMVLPWHRSSSLPSNVLSGNAYQGVNILNLWVMAQVKHYGSHEWGTYKQWTERGAQVRKGEKSSLIVFYKAVVKDNDEGEPEERRILKWSYVFNADQVDGYTPEALTELSPIERDARIDRFLTATGAVIREGGSQAFYTPSGDYIQMPDSQRFFDTDTGKREEHFYSTLMHELVHNAVTGIMPDGVGKWRISAAGSLMRSA